MVEGSKYRFTMFQARELALVVERATFPSVCFKTQGVPNTACILPVRKGAALNLSRKAFYPCNDRGQSKELFRLVQVKGDAVFGNPILFESPCFSLE